LSLAWIAGLGLGVALYLHGYQKPWWTPSPLTALYHPVRAVIYFLGFVGGPFGLEKVRLSIVAGVVLTTGFIWSLIYVLKHRADRPLVERAIGWLVIGAYSVLTAGLTTIGRLGLPTGPSQVPRYLGFSAYLPLALIFLLPIVGADISRRRGDAPQRLHPVCIALFVVVILYQPFMFVLSFRQMQKWQTRLQQAKASILLINELPDTRLTKILYPNLQFLIEKSNALDRLGFLRPKLITSKHLKDFAGDANGHERDYGLFDEMQNAGEHKYAAFGWAVLANQQRMPDAIILAYDTGDGDETAFHLTYPVRGGSSAHPGTEIGSWQTSFSTEQLPSAPVSITAWAFDVNSGKAFRLGGRFKIDGP